jgi:predicted ATPase/DNA-binding SARP family transcriptional activator
MRFGVLGPTVAWTDDGAVVPISGAKVRALLTHLVLHAGTPVTADRLIEDLWDEPTRRNPAGALSAKVSQLRRALDEAEPGARALVVSPPPGYRIDVAGDAVDVVEFERLVAQGQASTDPHRTVELLDHALGLWRGPACAEFADAEFTRTAIVRLDDLRLTARETLAHARLDLGEHAQVVDALGEQVAAHPWRERLRLAHVLALYRSGRQQEALAGFEQYRRHLADELGLDPSPAAVAVQRAILAQDSSVAAPVPRRPREVSNLPAQLTPLIGRDDAVTDLTGSVPAGRLTTLTGPGGVGKTTLALEVGRRLRERFPSGAWLVELAGIERSGGRDSAAAVAELVLSTLGIRQLSDAPGSGPVARLADALREARTLLILDNCEQVVGSAAELVDRLLRGAPDVTVLATSREPLGLAGETVWTVPPLTVPEPRDQTDIEAVRRAPAVRLFVARARAADRAFDLDTWNAPMVGSLCRRLDGIPLALELAATRVATLGVAEVLARLGDRFRLLSASRRDAPARHATLEAVIEWSWELLTPDERAVLRGLAGHVDGCALAAAEATCAGADVQPGSVADVLGRLVERSLVTVVHGRGGTRYRLLESVGAYAAARSAEAGESAGQRVRHRAYYAELVARARLTDAGQAVWFARLDEEAANIRAAIESAVADGAADDALAVVATMSWFWHLRGRVGEARGLIDLALGVPGATAGVARAECLTWQAVFAAMQGDVADLPVRRAAALAAFDAVDEPVTRARASSHLGLVTLDTGDAATGEALLTAGCAASAAHGDTWGEALALVSLAKIAQIGGELAELDRTAGRADRLFAELGDRWGRCAAAAWLGALAEMTGDLERAREINEAGLRDAAELSLWPTVAERLGWLGWLAVQRGDLAEARRLGTEAHALAVEQGSTVLDVFATMVIGFAARRAGDLDEAQRQLGRLRDEAGAAAEPAVYLPVVLVELGHAAQLRGDPAGALAAHVTALDLALEHNYPRDTAAALEGAANAVAGLGDAERGARLLGAASAHRDRTSLPAAASERTDIDRAAALCRTALGDSDYTAAFDAGTELSPTDSRRLLAPAHA